VIKVKEINKFVLFIIFWVLITCVIFLIHVARNQSPEGNGHEINQKKEGNQVQKIMISETGCFDAFQMNLTVYQ